MSAAVPQATETDATPDFVARLAWACLFVAASGVLLIAVLAAAQGLIRRHPIGAAAAGAIGCAGYLGVSIARLLRGMDSATVRLVVLPSRSPPPELALLHPRDAGAGPTLPIRARLACSGAILASVLPTLVVAITKEQVFGTVAGGLAGLLVVAVAALAASQLGVRALIAIVAVGLVLVAPVAPMLLLYDVVVGPAYGWPLALLAVAIGAGVAVFRQRL